MKNKKIILAGGGTEKESKELDRFFVSLIKRNKKLIYIPIAMDSRPYSDCFNWFNKAMKKLNFNNFGMVTNLKKFKISKNIGAIYIGGGNTFKLLKEIRQSNFDKKLLKFIKDGGIIYGGSAGAIILGKDILTSSDNNENVKDNFDGLNLINNYSVWCHYNNEDEKIFDYIKSRRNNVIAISEKSGIFINGNNFKVIGEPAFLFKGNEKIKLPSKKIIDLTSF